MVTLGQTERVPEKGASGREQEPVVCAAMLACIVMHPSKPIAKTQRKAIHGIRGTQENGL